MAEEEAETAAAGSDPSAGLSKAEKNRRKREKKKALQAAPFFCLKAERQDAGPGRGKGMFALEDVDQGAPVVCAVPALSVIFEHSAFQVCSFCFRHARDFKTPRKAQIRRGPSGGFGILIDGSIVTGFAEGSVNAGGELATGDVLASVEGKDVGSGDDSAVSLIKASKGDSLEVGLAALRRCHRCSCLACCPACAEFGLAWHSHECEEFLRLAPEEKRGDTSALRMLLRYRALQEHGDWAGPEPPGKEPLSLLPTLQATATAIPAPLLSRLSRVTGVSEEVCSTLIFQIRTNAAEIHRGQKVGCALSVYVGYTNHDCDPNTAASIDADGHVCLTAKRPIKRGEEVTFSYVDRHATLAERRRVLKEHFGFTCQCRGCVKEEQG